MQTDDGTIAQPGPAARTVLVVENDPAVLELVFDALQSAGYRVLTAPTAFHTLRLSELERGPIHLLLTDISLPDFRGQALAAQLRAARPELRVLYISGYPRHELEEQGSRLDAPLLAKPFLIADLERAVREVLDASCGQT